MNARKLYSWMGMASLMMLSASCGNSTNPTAPNPGATPSATPSTTPTVSPTPTPTNAMTITIPNGAMNLGTSAYSPNPANVSAGMTVTWQNNDSVAHTATSDTNGLFDTGNIAPGQSKSITVPQGNGALNYHCTIHPGMKGTLNVTGPSPSPSPSPSMTMLQ